MHETSPGVFLGSLQNLFISKPVMAFAGMMQNKKISVAPSAIFMDFPLIGFRYVNADPKQ